MDINLKWQDLVKLAAKGEVSKGEIIVKIKRPVLPDLKVAPDGASGFVRFTLDESDPRSKD